MTKQTENLFCIEPGTNLEKLRDFAENLAEISQAIRGSSPSVSTVQFDLTEMKTNPNMVKSLRPHWVGVAAIDAEGGYLVSGETILISGDEQSFLSNRASKSDEKVVKHAALQEMVLVAMLATGILERSESFKGISFCFSNKDIEDVLTCQKWELPTADAKQQADILTRQFSDKLDVVLNRKSNVDINPDRKSLKDFLGQRLADFRKNFHN